ncbi:hypothetical protein PAPYR_1980 [Paratrimastix pyriformis]|uniref:Fibronectin type-III domain-containing protein n=1 Tax=Paratrimastix pyriformis TaxID=342808 RepID=A0ABQ8UQI7_9EUKA|nr:hypothetical protein PAPYR_1980 [Paratrimastix pyriformis]
MQHLEPHLVKSTCNSLELAWAPVEGARFTLEMSEGPTDPLTLVYDGETPCCQVVGLTPSTLYRFLVTAKKSGEAISSEDSSAQKTISFSTERLPVRPPRPADQDMCFCAPVVSSSGVVQILKMDRTPGPGAYTPELVPPNPRASGTFSMMSSPRFSPGSPRPSRLDGDMQSMLSTASRPMSVFASGSPRFAKLRQEAPPVGLYNVPSPMARSVAASEASVAFSSTTPRFPPIRVHSPDVGSYDPVRPSSPAHTFFERSQRFPSPRAQAPPPGAYNPVDPRRDSPTKSSMIRTTSRRFPEPVPQAPPVGAYSPPRLMDPGTRTHTSPVHVSFGAMSPRFEAPRSSAPLWTVAHHPSSVGRGGAAGLYNPQSPKSVHVSSMATSSPRFSWIAPRPVSWHRPALAPPPPPPALPALVLAHRPPIGRSLTGPVLAGSPRPSPTSSPRLMRPPTSSPSSRSPSAPGSPLVSSPGGRARSPVVRYRASGRL